MKRRRENASFIEQLKRTVRSLRDMKPGEVHVLSINANYGHYQIVIGAKGVSDAQDSSEMRPIEINGEIHHLFVSPRAIRAMPSRQQVMENLKNTVIMNGLTVHLRDPLGDGHHLSDENGSNGLHAREYINLAGTKGDELIERAEHSGSLSMAAYRLIQEDILHAIRERKRKKTLSAEKGKMKQKAVARS